MAASTLAEYPVPVIGRELGENLLSWEGLMLAR